MKLVVDEINEGYGDGYLTQEFYTDHWQTIVAVRPHLVVYDMVNDDYGLTLNLLDSDDNILGTKSMTLEYMKAQGDLHLSQQYYHGITTFEFDNEVNVQDGYYTLQLEGYGGYSYHWHHFFGWVKETDQMNNEGYYGDYDDLLDYPHTFELWTYQQLRD